MSGAFGGDIRRPGIDPLPRDLNFGEDRGRTKAPADYESQLVAVATRQVRAENALGRGYTNGYVQLGRTSHGRITFAIVTLCSAEEPGLSLEER
jgi:hypothetical protein